MGAETGYAGWIPSYSLIVDITSSESAAAYLSSLFWAALTLGRVLAIYISIYISSTRFLRFLLLLCLISGFFCITILNISYNVTAFISFFFGFALSAMFPIMMTIFGDYGFKIDHNTTTLFMVGATTGESLLPVLIGICMGSISPYAMPIIVFLCTVILALSYLMVHRGSTAYVTSIGGAQTGDSQSDADEGTSGKKKGSYSALGANDIENSSHPLNTQSNNISNLATEEDDDRTYNPLYNGQRSRFRIEAEEDDDDNIVDDRNQMQSSNRTRGIEMVQHTGGKLRNYNYEANDMDEVTL
jgi:hypothetical protein